MDIWQYFLFLITVLAGGLLGLYFNSSTWKRALPYLLSFSGAYLLAIVSLELIPETFSAGATKGLGIFLLAGFLIQLLLEHLSQGVEHGHIHARKNAAFGYGAQVMIGLSLHAFLEGLPLSNHGYELAHDHSHSHSQNLYWGILLHKLPAAFALALLLRQSGYSKVISMSCLAFFALMSPLGAWIGSWAIINDLWQHRILAIVIGSLLHISTTILFEADGKGHHRISPKKLITILVGIGIAWLTTH